MDKKIPEGKNRYIYLPNVHSQKQLDHYMEIEEQGICPFCPEYLAENHKQPTLYETPCWILTSNQYHYKNAKQHFMVIAKEHAENILDLPDTAFTELGEIMRFVEKKYRFTGGGLLFRFGDPRYSGATIKHLHMQITEPDIENMQAGDQFLLHLGKSLKTNEQ